MSWIYLIIIILGVGLDQLVKSWAIAALPAGQELTLIPNFLALTRLNNRGAAYNILSGQKILFLLITIIAIAVLTYLLIKYQHKSRWLTVGIAFLLAGTLGNGWDRLLRGYVVDMVYFNIFNLPLLNFVCNLADILITIGVMMLIVYVFKSDNQRGEE